MAEDYSELLATGEKSVYAALGTTDMARIVAQARRAGLPRRSTRLGVWEFLSFPGVRDEEFGLSAPSAPFASVLASFAGSRSRTATQAQTR